MPKTVIITAADEAFMPLLRGLLLSLQDLCSPHIRLAVFDLGLSPSSRAWVATQVDEIQIPNWDLPIAHDLMDEKAHLRALTCRPFLPLYFPGYQTYIWLDADTWVQNSFAIDWLIDGAAAGALAACPESDRCYRWTDKADGWRRQRLDAAFGAASLRFLDKLPYVNAGVFALRGDAMHWALWGKHYRMALSNSKGRAVSDQTALNHALWTESLPLNPLPALCNWTIHLGLPSWDKEHRSFVEPFIPRREIGILHLTGDTAKLRLVIPGEPEVTSFANPAIQFEMARV